MLGLGGRRWLLAASVLLLGTFLFVAIVLKSPTVEQENATAVLALITAGAVAIERVIEAFWVIMGANGRPWWPFTKVGYRLENMINSLNNDLTPIRDKAKELVGAVGERAEAAAELANQFPNLNQAHWLINNLNQLGPSNRRARNLAEVASKSAEWFEQNHPEEKIKDAAARVQYTADTITNFLDTFNDNPARRLISLVFGCIIGVIVAGALGLDAFKATLGTTPPYVVGIFYNAGTAITGIVIGLGANPTHELIKTLQETKQRNRSA
jgi:hypothetical protein